MGILSKFPSYDFLFRAAGNAVRRFPFTLTSACVATVIALVLIGHEPGPDPLGLQRIFLVSMLGLSLFTAIVALAERRHWSRNEAWGIQIAAAIVLFLYYLALPSNPFEHLGTIVRFLLFAIGSHLLVAFLPYLAGDQV